MVDDQRQLIQRSIKRLEMMAKKRAFWKKEVQGVAPYLVEPAKYAKQLERLLGQ